MIYVKRVDYPIPYGLAPKRLCDPFGPWIGRTAHMGAFYGGLELIGGYFNH
ncbi:MAG: hypothetical protein AMXMBFR84_47220 [Candidatus Hydrogenedentota bacterium]